MRCLSPSKHEAIQRCHATVTNRFGGVPINPRYRRLGLEHCWVSTYHFFGLVHTLPVISIELLEDEDTIRNGQLEEFRAEVC